MNDRRDRRDRRAAFFLIAAVVCLALVPASADYWWVALATAGVYVVLAVAALVDSRSRGRDRH